MFGGGIYHYISGALGDADVRGQELAGALLPGWRFLWNSFTVTVYLGLDVQQHRLTPDDPSAGLRGSYAGARTGCRTLVRANVHDDVCGRRLGVHDRPELQRAARDRLARLRCVLLGPEVQGFGRRQLPAVPRRRAPHRLPDRRLRMVGRRRLGLRQRPSAAAPTASSACSPGASRACGGSASPRSASRAASGRPARARRSCRSAKVEPLSMIARTMRM